MELAVIARSLMVFKLNPVLTRYHLIKLAEFNLWQTTTMKLVLEIGFKQTTSVNTEREALVQLRPELSASQKSDNNVKDMTWLKSTEAEINATARNLTVKKLPLTELNQMRFMILVESFLLLLLLLLLLM